MIAESFWETSLIMSLRFIFRVSCCVSIACVLAWPIEKVLADGGIESTSHGPWPFTPPVAPAIPQVSNSQWIANPIDAFVLKQLENEGLAPNQPENRLRLLRRVTFDLTGLPPSIAQQQSFLADTSPDAYAREVDRLLSSPQLGLRWAQHWLDVVRFAETDGFKADVLRPNAFRYRDYVIDSFNSDRPYDEFVRQQLAGDELEPDNPQALVATGLNRLYPDEDNAANLFQRRQEILDDITETTGLAFLGLTMGCAQCHDHKFDKILQADYFRLQAFFAPLVERDDLPLASVEERKRYESQMEGWEQATAEIRAKMEALLAEKRSESEAYSLSKFEPDIQQCVLTPPTDRTPYQEQIARIAGKQLHKGFNPDAAAKKLSEGPQAEYRQLEQQLAKFDHLKPNPLPLVMAVSDLGPKPPPTRILDGGSLKNPLDEVLPGFPQFLGESKLDLANGASSIASSGRRTALARWLTSGKHPLTARVIVNRLWHHHLGRGVVGTPNDFGVQGEPPTHPELLDWLAVQLVENNWSLKHIHRLIVTSSTYCQSSTVNPSNAENAAAIARDPDNKLLWHARRRRLEGEAVRDAMLSASEQLNTTMYGQSSRPQLPEGVSKRYAWEPNKRIEDQRRRSIFVLAKRNMRFPLFDAFDLPDMHNSCGMRTQSTTPPQALLMLNSDDTLGLAADWAKELYSRFSLDHEALIAHLYASALGRKASQEELANAVEFLTADVAPNSIDGITDLCHSLFNCNEFIYVD